MRKRTLGSILALGLMATVSIERVSHNNATHVTVQDTTGLEQVLALLVEDAATVSLLREEIVTMGGLVADMGLAVRAQGGQISTVSARVGSLMVRPPSVFVVLDDSVIVQVDSVEAYLKWRWWWPLPKRVSR